MASRARRPAAPPLPELLDALGRGRSLAITLGAAEKSYTSERYRLCDALKEAIDAVAADLTGDPTYFHAKPHGRNYKAMP